MEIITLIFWFFVILLYFAPSMVAMKNNHKHTDAIQILNLLLGWTFLGWVAALVWANAKY